MGESYIDSDRQPDSKRDIATQVGHVLAAITLFNVDVSYYMQFAKPVRDSLRLRRAQPLQILNEVLDMSSRQPLRKTTPGVDLVSSLSRYACCQYVSQHLFGTEDRLHLVLCMKTPSEQIPGAHVMVWFHDSRAVSSNAWSFLRQHNGAQLACVHIVVSVCAQYRLAVLGFSILKDVIDDMEAAGVEAQLLYPRQAFEDQRSLMLWVQDNAAGLDADKTDTLMFGYGIGG